MWYLWVYIGDVNQTRKKFLSKTFIPKHFYFIPSVRKGVYIHRKINKKPSIVKLIHSLLCSEMKICKNSYRLLEKNHIHAFADIYNIAFLDLIVASSVIPNCQKWDYLLFRSFCTCHYEFCFALYKTGSMVYLYFCYY